ncbi:hypothetical protein [Flammeovirga sp. SubArs3]|uniref:hypothetical protein n=1 Tax=Flammeovirga sp. SubArs3 TaxID=2995316 RepID=UPI00248A9CB9|nr:hypothetical protein [Flammeovirga sp. SubArs3]
MKSHKLYAFFVLLIVVILLGLSNNMTIENQNEPDNTIEQTTNDLTQHKVE